jgi:predicted permease
LFTGEFLNVANKFCFRVALPCLLFKNISQYGIQGFLKGPYIIFVVISIVLIAVLLTLLIPKIVSDRRKCGTMVQGIFRSNYIILGLPIVINMFGEEHLGSASAVVPISIIVFNFLAVAVLSYFSHDKDVNVFSWNMVKKIMTNPLIIATLIGVVYEMLPVKLPNVLYKPISDMAAIATPLALLTVGGQFEFNTVTYNKKELFLAVTGKLVIMPSIFLPIAILLGYKGTDLAPLIVLFGGPTAVSSYVMAKDMGCDSDLAAQIIIFTTLISMVSLFGWVFLLKAMNFL